MSAQTSSVAIFIESHSIVRERVFRARDVDYALSILRAEHATGKLILNLSGGTIGSIQFEERAKLPK